MNRSLVPGVLLIGLALLPGCSKDSVKLAPVSGKVTLNGQPVTAGQVSLVPLSAETKTPGIMTGALDSSGAYEISTAGKSGAPLGKYRVTVSPSTMPKPGGQAKAPAAVPPRYMDPINTPLTIEVIDNPPPNRYDLKLSK